MMRKRKVLIIGGGVAGPALALFLHRAGIESAVFEAGTEADNQAGAFLNVASNGMDVLQTLGLDGAVAAEGIAAPRMMMWNGQGKQLGEVANGLPPGKGLPSITVKRSELHNVLHQAVVQQGIQMEFGKKLEEIELGPDDAEAHAGADMRGDAGGKQGVTALFSDGSRAHGDLLVGADGIHSRTRQIIDPPAPSPHYTGLISFGGYARLPEEALRNVPRLTQHLVFGKRAFFGYLVKPDGEIYWFENLAHPGAPRRSQLETVSDAAWKTRLLAMHQEDQPLIQAIIRATTSKLSSYPIYDIPSQSVWHKGPVVLVGDAAHATSPSAGQGASLALEDAIVLAKSLRDLPETRAAFRTFEQLRRARAEKIVKFSRQLGTNKVTSNPVARWWRDTTLPFILRHLAKDDALVWLANYKVAWDTPVGQA